MGLEEDDVDGGFLKRFALEDDIAEVKPTTARIDISRRASLRTAERLLGSRSTGGKVWSQEPPIVKL